VHVTEVMPARPPQIKRLRGSSWAPGVSSKYCSRQQKSRWSRDTNRLVQIVGAKLRGRVGHYPDAIGAVARHETLPAFLLPHLAQGLADGHLVGITAGALDLEQNLEPLERRDDGARDGAGAAAGGEGGDDGLRGAAAEAVRRARLGGGRRLGRRQPLGGDLRLRAVNQELGAAVGGTHLWRPAQFRRHLHGMLTEGLQRFRES
jgi:hypothetical protein